MSVMVVVSQPKDWSLDVPGVEVVLARTYLADPTFAGRKGIRLFNLCRSYRYQSTGYYVSLLGTARDHRPMPDIPTIQDMKSTTVLRSISWDLDELIQKSFRSIRSDRFTLSIYFGRNVAKGYDELSRRLFNLAPAPFLRAEFVRAEEWMLTRLHPMGANDIPAEHRSFAAERTREFFDRPAFRSRPRKGSRFDMAILVNPKEDFPPSNERALVKFEKAARKLGIEPERIEREDYGRLAQFDALFIRETTAVNHHTYRFARKAAAEGLVVIDDPLSIIHCTNKVYLAELLAAHKVPAPRSMIIHKDNLARAHEEIGLPAILKMPDSSFSQGVVKASTPEEFAAHAEEMLSDSDLIIAQEFMPTPFDWRVGVLNGEALYACRYHMARNHWQIIKNETAGSTSFGDVDTMRVEDAPKSVVRTALRASKLIGRGLYGVDLKMVGNQSYVIEVNDNPSIDSGYEDRALHDELYLKIMNHFLRRIEAAKAGKREI